jgi:membrane-associated phospholipid phosphatase
MRSVLAAQCAVLLLSLSATARSEPDTTTTTTLAEATASTTPAEAPAPLPEADLKVESGAGKAVVVQDPTTPVLPDKQPFPERAYQLQWEIDVPLFAIGAALALGRQVRSTNGSAPAYCTTIPEGCNPDDLNPIDKPFAGNYDERWSDATDVALWTMFVAPWPMLWIDNSFLNAVNDITIIYESALTALALSGLATLSASRPRPFVYGTKAPEDVRTSPNGALSFVSGHTTLAFALSTSTFWTIYRRHGSGPYAWTTLGVGTAVASFVGVGRVAAGKHFPTDVLTGAAVGGAVGTLIPALHDTPVLVVPSIDATGAGVDVSLSL